MKYEIKREKISLKSKMKNTIELVGLMLVICSLGLTVYVSRMDKEQTKVQNEELVEVFKETELYHIFEFDQIEENSDTVSDFEESDKGE